MRGNLRVSDLCPVSCRASLQAADIQNVVKKNPTIGFSLILQLTGVNGSRQFDKLTKTKTVETILTSMEEEGIKHYIDYLLKQVDEEPSASGEYVLVPFFSSCHSRPSRFGHR